MSVLRFVTAGSVDDGKSTLIGRLLLDTQAVFEDQLLAIEKASVKRGMDETDLSLFTDGLLAEREQGITIDVAYRYFATSKRKFIVADCPGHKQYTRNMVTGASNAQLAVLLVDAQKGLSEQTRRHAAVCAWLGIEQIVLAINKMDLLDFSQARFEAIRAEFQAWCLPLGISQLQVIPMSAVLGDMVVHRGDNLAWYQGPTLLEALESAPANLTIKTDSRALIDVQRVIRANSERFYAGRTLGQAVRIGDTLTAVPSGVTAKVEKLYVGDKSINAAEPGQSISVQLDREIDLGRGDLLVQGQALEFSAQAQAEVAWFSSDALQAGKEVLIKQGSRRVKARVESLVNELDLSSLDRSGTPNSLPVDALGRIGLRFLAPLPVPEANKDSTLGRFIMIDPVSAATLGAGFLQSKAAHV